MITEIEKVIPFLNQYESNEGIPILWKRYLDNIQNDNIAKAA